MTTCTRQLSHAPSQGLGRHFARLLASQGASVALAARQLGKLESLAKEIACNGGRAVPVLMDVTDTASITKAFDAAEAQLGPVSVLINNAGVVVEKAAIDQTEANVAHRAQQRRFVGEQEVQRVGRKSHRHRVESPPALITLEHIGLAGIDAKPCGVLNVDGYYDAFLTFLDRAVEDGFLRPQHRAMLLVDSAADALVDRLASYTPPLVEKWLTREGV